MSKPIYGVTVGTPLNPEIVVDEAFEKSKEYLETELSNYSGAIKKTIESPLMLMIDDISPVKHKCYGRLYKNGSKNIFKANEFNTVIGGASWFNIADNGVIDYTADTSGYKEDSVVRANFQIRDLKVGETYTFSTPYDIIEHITYYYKDGKKDEIEVSHLGYGRSEYPDEINNSVTFTHKEDVDYYKINCLVYYSSWRGFGSYGTEQGEIKSQLEIGEVCTKWSAYEDFDYSTLSVQVGNKKYTPNKDGTFEIISNYPTMWVDVGLTDCLITLTYNLGTQQYIDNAINNIPPTDLSNYYNREEIDASKVGQKTLEGGEIFNDYEENKAISPYSTAGGHNNIAGGKYFNILGISKITGTTGQVKCIITLDDVDGLEEGDEVCAKIQNNYTNFGKIVNINSSDNSIGIDAIPLDYKFPSTNPPEMLWVLTKPFVGTTIFGEGQVTHGMNNIAIADGSASFGVSNTSAGMYGFTSGAGNLAGYAAHAQNKDNKALGHYSSVGGHKNEAIGMWSDCGGVNSKTVGNFTFARGSSAIAGTKAFQVKSINFEMTPAEETEIITGQVVDYYVGTNNSATQDGSKSYPYTSIADAIDNCKLTNDNDVLNIILLSNIGWPRDPSVSHKFKVIVKSNETRKTITISAQNANFKGRMDFYNVAITGTKTLRFGTYDIRMDKDSSIDVYYVRFGAANTERTVNGQTIKLEGEVRPVTLSIPNNYHSNTYTEDVNVILGNYRRGQINFDTASDDKNITTYNANINFDFKDAAIIPDLSKLIDNPKVVFNGNIQIINSSTLPINSNTSGIDELPRERKWIITNISACKDVLGFTNETGKFSVREGYKATAYNIYDEAIEAIDGILDLSALAGEYTVDIIESAPHNGTFGLDSVVGLELNDVVSIRKHNGQEFIVNAGNITNIDTDTSIITVSGYPSQINRFLNTTVDLFVLAKPKIGTIALGEGSNALGSNTRTIGKGSVANGKGTLAIGDYQTVYGSYNANKPDTVLEIGCGTSDTDRTNAFEVYEDGSVRLYDIKITRERWRKLLEKSLEEVSIDLTDYIKNTDYATHEKAGIVRPAKGLIAIDGELEVEFATAQDIGDRTANRSLGANLVEEIVASGIVSNSIILSNEQKANACEWLGVNALAIPNVISGGEKSLTVDDVSPLAHKCSCRLTSDNYTEVTGDGKNIFETAPNTTIDEYSGGDLPEGFSGVINIDGSITFNGLLPIALRPAIAFRLDLSTLEEGKTYTFSIRNNQNKSFSGVNIWFNQSGAPAEGSFDEKNNVTELKYTFTYTNDLEQMNFRCWFSGNNELFENLTFYPQLEVGNVMTDWQSYGGIETKPYITDFSTVKVIVNSDMEYTPNPDGTVEGIISTSSMMIIETDNTHINICDFTYCVDTKKYIDNNSGGGSALGDIETALDNIIAIQENLIGGGAE